MTGIPDSNKPNGVRKAVGAIFAVACGLVLVRSAMFHLGNPFGFLATVYSYDLLSQATGVVVAAVLPAAQLVLGLLLVLFAEYRKTSMKFAAWLFVGLAVVQLVTLYRGLNITCGCFGPSVEENPIGPSSIGLAAGCAVLAFLGDWMTTDEKI